MFLTTTTSLIVYLTVFFFFFNDTATTEIYTLSLHDALPILTVCPSCKKPAGPASPPSKPADRKSTRLNSSHVSISYAVFCLKKKKHTQYHATLLKKHNKQCNHIPKKHKH